MLFLIFEKMMGKKTVLGIFKFVSMLFLIFEKGMSKKTVLGILRFASMLFKYLKRRCVKNCPRYFQIRKYAF